jgi:hypothetical protein
MQGENLKLDYPTLTVETVSLYNKNQITEALLRDTVPCQDISCYNMPVH